MRSPSFRDMKNLSAYLDGQISLSERTRLEKRIQSDAALAAALQRLRQARTLLQRTPKRRSPRSFVLTARMAGIRPPVPRLVPAFAWASALAMVLFVFTLGTSLAGHLSFGAASPMLARPASGFGGGPPAAAPMVSNNPAPATAAPASKMLAPPGASDQTLAATPTVEISLMAAPAATQPASTGGIQQPAQARAPQKPSTTWLVLWPGLALLLGGLALLVLWLNQRAFQRNNPPG